MVTSVITPAGKDTQNKSFSIARTDTTATLMFGLPKGATFLYATISGDTASDAGTSAVIDVGDGTTADKYVAAADVKASGAVTQIAGQNVGALAADTYFYGKYTEAGTASTTGGPWTITVFYAP